jgi:signal transduction histidine kinase
MATEETANPTSLRPQELEAMYAISRTVALAVDIDAALDAIIPLARPVFIFDNIVLYTQRADATIEPSHARAIGRGRFREADLAWGEPTAQEAYQTRQTTLRVEVSPEADEDRISKRFILGLPLTLRDQVMGALVFIRFGGPPYSPDQIHLAEFIGYHVGQLIGHRQLVERVASLEAKRRLDSLQDNFIATITHELLTPLGFIKGYATTLLRDDINWDDQTRREFLTIIDEESDRLRELIDNLMDSSRLQSGTLRMNVQPVRIDALLKDISARAKARDESMQINLELKVTGIQIKGDPTRLAQVFENLLSNASKYAPGSPVDICLEITDGKAEILVRDYGPGIAPEYLKHIFNRFFRIPGQSTGIRGTGLGLFICMQIIEAHDGEIVVESEVGRGPTFKISLPCEPITTAKRTTNREDVK